MNTSTITRKQAARVAVTNGNFAYQRRQEGRDEQQELVDTILLNMKYSPRRASGAKRVRVKKAFSSQA